MDKDMEVIKAYWGSEYGLDKTKVCIRVASKGKVTKGNVLKISYQDRDRFFKVLYVETDGKTQLIADAYNCGYYYKINNDIDLRDLVGLTAELIADTEKIKELAKQDNYI